MVTVTGYASVSSFTLWAALHVGITSFAIELKICAMIAEIKQFKSIIKEKKYDEIVLLEKTKLDIIEVLISKTLIDSNIIYDNFFSVNNVLRENNKMKEEAKDSELSVKCTIWIWLI